ncbi:HAD family phosphatase [Lactiplantibacillus sp. WILCCON 0030]|uniref:HAD family phosphatase n=1 Tax=Lactiplantibacillus brownii TaxID=3069269 RepID=A0ABU1AEJ6_9LACO|nr:HAD family phosphatase [Lactiplantibacillus brownii]MDQ7938673.1 HAD family phosphatase [Lactiplantibacillus brownii]
MIDTMIFDFNGTMFFDAGFQKVAWKQFLMQNFKVKMTEFEFQKHIAGRNNRDTFEYYSRHKITEAELGAMTAEKEKIYCDLCLSKPAEFHLVAGLPMFLDQCQRQGIKLNIATASERSNVEFFFKHLNLARWFDIDQVSLNDFSLPGKPAPDMFLRAITNVQAIRTTCAIFEDSVSGIQAANRAQVGEIVLVEDPKAKVEAIPDGLRIDQKISDYYQISETLTEHK